MQDDDGRDRRADTIAKAVDDTGSGVESAPPGGPERAAVTDEAHAKDLGEHCPQCGADSPEGDSVDTGGGSASQKMYCMRCHASWIDTYELTGFILLQEGEKG